jgi:excisionase family DNA binding protein
MAGGLQVPERYLLPDAVGALLPGRIAALIYRRTNLGQVRTEVRGIDAEADAALMALHIAALKWRGSATGTTEAAQPELGPISGWLSTGEAAGLLGVTPRAVVKAIARGKLPAERLGGRHRISREDLEQYRAGRAA